MQVSMPAISKLTASSGTRLPGPMRRSGHRPCETSWRGCGSLCRRRDAYISVLMNEVIDWMCRVVLHLKHGNDTLLDIAVFVEADFALQRLQLGRCDRVPHGDPFHRLAGFRNALDRIDDDHRRVIGGDGVIGRLPAGLGGETIYPGL